MSIIYKIYYLAPKYSIMKQISTLALMMLFAFTGAFAKDRVSKHSTVKGDIVSVTYGQPSKNGREIFGGLVPFGQVWRTGADEATEITFTKGCMFAGRQVNPGTYTLFTIPGKDEWTIILNSELGQWGSFKYDEVKNKNVLNGTVAVGHLDKSVETFTIEVVKDGILMSWDKTSVFVEVKPW